MANYTPPPVASSTSYPPYPPAPLPVPRATLPLIPPLFFVNPSSYSFGTPVLSRGIPLSAVTNVMAPPVGSTASPYMVRSLHPSGTRRSSRLAIAMAVPQPASQSVPSHQAQRHPEVIPVPRPISLTTSDTTTSSSNSSRKRRSNADSDEFNVPTDSSKPTTKKPKLSSDLKTSSSEPDLDNKLSPAELTCCICLSEPKESDRAKINGCTHLFCFECIDKWAERENSCPLCKSRFNRIEYIIKRKRRKGEHNPSVKRVRQRDQRADFLGGTSVEALLAQVVSNDENFSRIFHRLTGSGRAGISFENIAMLPSSFTVTAVAGEPGVSFYSDQSDDESPLEPSFDSSSVPARAASMSGSHSWENAQPLQNYVSYLLRTTVNQHFHRVRQQNPHVATGPQRSYAVNAADQSAGNANNPLQIDDSDDEDDVQVLQVSRTL